jgi:predicted nucleotidyltransferase
VGSGHPWHNQPLTSTADLYIFCIHMPTKRIRSDSILEMLFTSKARVEILKLFFLSSSERHYMRQVAALTGQPIRAVQRELERLEGAGLLESHRDGNRKYFQANRSSPIFSVLRSLLVRTAGIGSAMREHLLKEAHAIQVAFIFGSYAQGSEGATSDLDLMVVGEIAARDLANMLKPAREAIGREVNAVIMHEEELCQRVEQEDNFVMNVLREAKIFLIGGEDELREIAGARTASAP